MPRLEHGPAMSDKQSVDCFIRLRRTVAGRCRVLSTRHARGQASEDSGAVGEAIYLSPGAIVAVPHLIAACGAEPSPPPDRESVGCLPAREAIGISCRVGATEGPDRTRRQL